MEVLVQNQQADVVEQPGHVEIVRRYRPEIGNTPRQEVRNPSDGGAVIPELAMREPAATTGERLHDGEHETEAAYLPQADPLHRTEHGSDLAAQRVEGRVRDAQQPGGEGRIFRDDVGDLRVALGVVVESRVQPEDDIGKGGEIGTHEQQVVEFGDEHVGAPMEQSVRVSAGSARNPRGLAVTAGPHHRGTSK